MIQIGDTFHYWTVVASVTKHVYKNKVKRLFYTCQCKCGAIKEIDKHSLLTGNSKSCGCLKTQLAKQRIMEDSPSWKGGRRLDESGYVLIYLPEHPKAKKNGYIREHTVVMEKELGRSLIKGESVHHKNGDRSDNSIANLELWSTSQPYGQRVEDKIEWAIQLLRQYAPEALKNHC